MSTTTLRRVPRRSPGTGADPRRKRPSPRRPRWPSRYALAVTPEMADAHRSERSERPDRPPVPARSARTRPLGRRSATTRSATPRTAPARASCTAIPDRVLLKLLHVCAVYCRFCFPSRDGGAGPADRAVARRPRHGDRLYRGAPGDLGGHPHRRRPARRLAPPPRRCRRRASPRSRHVRILRVHTRMPGGGARSRDAVP